MPRPNNKYSEIDREYDNMSLDEIQELLDSKDLEEIKEYTKYLTRKAKKVRSLFNSGKPHKKPNQAFLDERNEHWSESIERSKNENKVYKYENKVEPKYDIKDEKVISNPRKKLTSLEKDIVNFKKKYLIDVENVAKELEKSFGELNSKTRLTKYGDGGRKSYTFVIDDNKKDEFYSKYKDAYKSKFKDACKLFLKKQRVELTISNINEFIKSYDHIIRYVIHKDKNFMVPSYGCMNLKEFKNMVVNLADVKYCNDSYFDTYIKMSIKDCSKLTTKQIDEILAQTHKNFAEVLNNSQSENDPLVQGKRVIESIQKSYLVVSKIHSTHGFWYKLFNKKTYNKEQTYLDIMKNVCATKFRISDRPLTDDDFFSIIASPISKRNYMIQTKAASLDNLFSNIGLTPYSDGIIKEDKILEDEENAIEEVDEELEEENDLDDLNRINISIDMNNNVINEDIDELDESIVSSEELSK